MSAEGYQIDWPATGSTALLLPVAIIGFRKSWNFYRCPGTCGWVIRMAWQSQLVKKLAMYS